MTNKHIIVSIKEQTMQLMENETLLKHYVISSAKNGVGEQMDSECTPRGEHSIAEKIGDDVDVNTVFISRLPTGEIYEPALRELHPERDWILTRILWLRGEEDGKNKHGQVDSHDRYIYIHGTPDDVTMGEPGSRGCIRMRNEDIIELFELVETGTRVTINE